MKIGYHASHEQFSPGMLLKLVQQAELAGFDAVMSSDHLAPWSLRQGQAGNAWAWLGAAMQATNLPFGSLAIPGGSRYHPVILAQLVATLAEMFPGRLPWIAAGSGEAMNEHMSGEAWPSKQDRNARLKSGVDMMRALWAGETVNRTDGPIKAHNAKYGPCRKRRQKFMVQHYRQKQPHGPGHGRMGLLPFINRLIN